MHHTDALPLVNPLSSSHMGMIGHNLVGILAGVELHHASDGTAASVLRRLSAGVFSVVWKRPTLPPQGASRSLA
jgi:hypothetical protein